MMANAMAARNRNARICPGRSRPRPLGSFDLGDAAPAEGERYRRDRDDREEDPAPAEVIDDEPTDGRSDPERERVDPGPDRQGLRALLVVVVRGVQDRQAAGERERGADAEEGPADDEDAGAGREAAEHRRDGEDDDADQEDALAPEEIAERRAGQDQAGVDDVVRVEHPLELGDAGVKTLLERAEREVDDSGVELDHRDREAGRGHGELRGGVRAAPGDDHAPLIRRSRRETSRFRTSNRPCPRRCTHCVELLGGDVAERERRLAQRHALLVRVLGDLRRLVVADVRVERGHQHERARAGARRCARGSARCRPRSGR